MASLMGIGSTVSKLSKPFSTSKPNPRLAFARTPTKKIQERAFVHASSSNIAVADSEHLPTSEEEIHYWMLESIADIVQSLGDAPSLVQVYANKRGISIRVKKAVRDQWHALGDSKSPDGLIFIEELRPENIYCDGGQENVGVTKNGADDETKVWGIVVQGSRGSVEDGPPPHQCYLLKTDRVSAGIGLPSCVHACLMKVNNFRDCALQQFGDSWSRGVDVITIMTAVKY